MSHSSKAALITGSTSGIGLGVARHLAKEGYHIMLNGLGDAAAIRTISQEFSGFHQKKILYSPANMTKPEEIQHMVKQAEEEFGTLDVLINNAGIQHVDFIEDFGAEKWDAIIAINLSSVFHTIAAALPGMKQRGTGRIINIASAHGLVASAKKSAYVAAKHGVVGLTKVVALENAASAITCNAICPGWVLTPLVEKQIAAIAAAKNIPFEDAKLELLSEKQPSKEFVSIEQIAQLVGYLCSNHASAITGAALSIDGGWTAQ